MCAITRPSVITRSTRFSHILCFHQLLHINYTLCDASLHTLIRTELSSSFHTRFNSNQHLPSIFFILLHLLGIIETLLQVVNTIFNWFNLISLLRYQQKLPVKSSKCWEKKKKKKKLWISALDSTRPTSPHESEILYVFICWDKRNYCSTTKAESVFIIADWCILNVGMKTLTKNCNFWIAISERKRHTKYTKF